MAEKMKSRHVDLTVDDGSEEREISIRYVAAGEGSPLILLHGIGVDAAPISWRHAIPELAKYHRVYGIDLPGHGGSEKPRMKYTSDLYRQTVAAFVDEFDLGTHAIAGLSMGGSIALGHALDHPEAVEKLALVASYGLGADAPWRPRAHQAHQVPFLGRLHYRRLGRSEHATRQHIQKHAVEVPDELVEDVYANVQDTRIARTATTWQRSEVGPNGLKTNYVDRLDEVEAETLIVHGVDDPLIPLSWAETATEGIRDSRLEIADDCGHWIPRERPEWFNRVVTRFFAGDAARPEAPGLLRAANRGDARSD